MADFLHDRRDFDQLLAVVADERGLDPMLVEKDYWIELKSSDRCAVSAQSSNHDEKSRPGAAFFIVIQHGCQAPVLNQRSTYFEAAFETAEAASLTAEAALETAAAAALLMEAAAAPTSALAAAAEALAASDTAEAAVAAGVGAVVVEVAAGGVAVCSGFLPHADRATTATKEANRRDVFMQIL